MSLQQIQRFIEGEKTNLSFLDKKIPGAERFKYYDFIWSPLAIKSGIYNMPDSDGIWKNIENLAKNILQPVYNNFGPIKIISGFRINELNKLFKGRLHSNHLNGTSVDFVPFHENVSVFNVLEFIEKELEYRELVAEYFPMGWIHASFQFQNNSMHLRLKDVEHDYERVSIDYIKRFYGDL